MRAMSSGVRPTGIAERLRERRGEIEQTTLARVYGISDPDEVEDPDYTAGLREAVRAGLDHALAAIESPTGIPAPGPVPEELLAQARYAARSGVSLDTVLRRYFAGYTLLGDFLVQIAEEGPVPAHELQRALRAAATLFDRLAAAVSREYGRELEGRCRTAGERRAAQVRMLLAGEPLDTSELGYELEGWHLGAIAAGPGARAGLRDLAGALDRRLLACEQEGVVWAWLGGKGRLGAGEALRTARKIFALEEASLAIGEPGEGVEGWRQSHRQAKAALPIALRGSRDVVRYGEVALLTSIVRDDVLADSLHEIYLEPLSVERDGGVTLRRTLRAYFAAGQNISSAAAVLGVTRQTVKNHLRAVEERIERPLEECAAEMDTVLRLQELGLASARKVE